MKGFLPLYLLHTMMETPVMFGHNFWRSTVKYQVSCRFFKISIFSLDVSQESKLHSTSHFQIAERLHMCFNV